MKVTYVLAAAATFDQASATFGIVGDIFKIFTGSKPFTCPTTTPIKCAPGQIPGWDFGDAAKGKLGIYGGFRFGDWSVTGGIGLRDVAGGNGKAIQATVGADGQTNNPTIEAGGEVGSFSVDSYSVSSEFDTRLEFIYTMPDGSTCRQSSEVSTQGTSVVNTQCGGASSVRVTMPAPSQSGNNKRTFGLLKKLCNIKIHKIKFHCIPIPSTSTTLIKTTRISTPPAQTTVLTTPPAQTTVLTTPPGQTTVPPAETTSTSVPPPQTTSKTTTPAQSTPGESTTPAQSTPGESTTPAQSTPGESTTPAQSTPGESTTPAQSTPGESSTPAQSTPAPSTPAQSTPGESTTPAQSTPGQSTSPGTSTAPVGTSKPPFTTSTVTTVYDTTSTVFTTTIKTITSCGPEVTACPIKSSGGTHIVTETIAVSTTVCPVTETRVVSQTQPPASNTAVISQPPASTDKPVPSGTDKPIVPSGTQTLPCPTEVPRCINTWLHLIKECKNNADAACFCKNQNFTDNIFSCLYSYGQDDKTVGDSIKFFQGICAPYVGENPNIATGAETITNILTVTPAPLPASVSVTTLTVSTTVTESGSTRVINTQVTVPQVSFTPPPAVTGQPGEPGPGPDNVKVPVPTGVTAPPAIVGTGGVTSPTGTPPPLIANGAGQLRAGIVGLVGMVLVAAL